jgi:hypothetical protein
MKPVMLWMKMIAWPATLKWEGIQKQVRIDASWRF